MSKSYRAIFLHVIFQIRKNHPFLLALRKQRKYSSKNFNSFFFFNCYQREISFPFGSRSIFPGNRTTNHRRRRRFWWDNCFFKSAGSTDPVGSFSTFIRGFWTWHEGVWIWCVLFLRKPGRTWPRYLLLRREHRQTPIAARTSLKRDFNAPHSHVSLSIPRTYFLPLQFAWGFCFIPCCSRLWRLTSFPRLILLIFLLLPFSIIPAACILRQVKLDYARIMRRSADGYKMNVKLDIVKE